MRKNLLLLVFLALGISSGAYAQINEYYDFEDGSMSSWQANSGDVMPYQPCAGGYSFRGNLYRNTLGQLAEITLTSPVYTSDGTELLFSFGYKVLDYPHLAPTLGQNYKITLQYSTDNGVSWNDKYTIDENNNQGSDACTEVEQTFAAGELPVGQVLFRLKTEMLATGYINFYTYFDNIKIQQSLSAPECATNLNYVANNASCGNFGGKITWNAVDFTDAYQVTVGTTSGGSDIINAQEVTTNEITIDTDASTTYYVKVLPKNSVGLASGCEEFTFTSASNICYCEAMPTSKLGNGITQIEFPTSTLSQEGSVTYADHTGTVIDIEKGAETPINFSFNTGFAYHVNVWVDLNKDYEFSADELLSQGISADSSTTTYTATIMLPASIADGTYRMRVVSTYDPITPANPCYKGRFGIAMDFKLNVQSLTSCVPMVATGTVVPDCDNEQFSVEVNVTQLNNGENIITDGNTQQTVTAVGTYTFGPYNEDTTVNITSKHSDMSVCNTSIGEFTHHCVRVGELCNNPISITSLPYNHTEDTANFADMIDMVNNQIVCHYQYTKGNDVFYSFTPQENTLINVSLSDLSDLYVGFNILTGCPDLDTTTCIASGIDGNGVEDISVTAGQTYIIWISSWAPQPQTASYTLNVITSPNASTIHNELTRLEIYPNPATEFLNIKNDEVIDVISVFDTTGKRVVHMNNVGQTEVSIPVKHLASGNYFVKIATKEKSATKQIIID